MTRAGEGETMSQGIMKVKRSMKKCEACRARKIAVSTGFATAGKERLKFTDIFLVQPSGPRMVRECKGTVQ
jgi:hypothetical protein